MSRAAHFGASALLGLGLAAVAFAGSGGLQLGQATLVEIPLILVGGFVLTVGALYGSRGRLHGALTLGLLAALLAITALSILWSIVPEESWREANRTLAYTMAFAGALVAARLAPEGWKAVLDGLLLAVAAVTVYALATRVWPGVLAQSDVFARISQPFGYWNAVGAVTALGVVPTLWLGARRAGSAAANALAYPLMGLIFVLMLLTYSRGSLLAAALGAGLWLLFVPLRLRSLGVLLAGAAGAAPVVGWALTKDAFTADRVPLAVRESVAPQFGMLLLVMAGALLVVGLAVGFRLAHRAPSITARRRVGVAAVAVLCMLPLLGVSAVAVSERGLVGTISARVSELTSTQADTAGGPERLGQVSSVRGRYWRQAGEILADADSVWLGTGAGTFGDARLRFRSDDVGAEHAHGYVPQTMADLGLTGLIVSLLLALAWLLTAARNTGLHPWARGRPFDSERVGMAALLLAALVYGVHSAIDWTWFVPGPTVMGLVAAAWVIGRGPLPGFEGRADAESAAGQESGRAAAAAAGAGASSAGAGSAADEQSAAGAAARRPAGTERASQDTLVMSGAAGGGAGTAGTGTAGTPGRGATADRAGGGQATGSAARAESAEAVMARFSRKNKLSGLARSEGWRIALALTVLTATLLGAWMAWQPQRSHEQSEQALALLEQRELSRAFAAADRAETTDPLSSEPLYTKSTIENAAGRPEASLRLLEQATRENPQDPETWLRLADFQLHRLEQPRAALMSLDAALFLDPRSRAARNFFFEARAAQRIQRTARRNRRAGRAG